MRTITMRKALQIINFLLAAVILLHFIYWMQVMIQEVNKGPENDWMFIVWLLHVPLMWLIYFHAATLRKKIK